MPRYYAKALRPTLAAKIEAIIDEAAPVEQLNVSEEVALLRAAAGDAVEFYANACENTSLEQRLIAGTMMSDKLKQVMAGVESMAKVEAVKLQVQGAFVAAMGAVITAVTRAAFETWGDDYRVAQFEARIREHLEVRNLPGYDGTELTPDQDVIEMDQTVPSDDSA